EDRAAFRRTLQGIADQFAGALESDLFEIVDGEGFLQAVPSGAATMNAQLRYGALPQDVSRESDVAAALQRRVARATRVIDGSIYQTVAVPVVAGGRLVGVLRHGVRLGEEMTERIRRITRCEVSFLVEEQAVVSTRLQEAGDFQMQEVALPDLLGPLAASFRLERSTDLEARFLNRLRWRLLVIGAFVVGFAFVLARVVAQRVIGPVEQLVHAASRLERGEADLPLELDTGDELEYLGRRFSEMRSALRRHIHALQELDRMKTIFLTVASHELRTPATIIGGVVDLIRDMPEVKNHPPLNEMVEALANGSGRLQRVVGKITDMSLLDRSQMDLSMAAVDGRVVLDDLHVDWLQMRGARPVALVLEGADVSASIWVDRARIRQALGNLLHNALRFTSDEGEVRLVMERSDDVCTFAVEDSGPGVPADERERIFERFYETQDVLQHSSGDAEFGRSGLGIGLAIARGIVHAHGGTVRCEERRGGGSRFVVELPLAKAEGAVSSGDAGRRAQDLAA
ncbi:MAG: HAMP domain-containing histidine kinase, partial [Candidatus Eisenbacteria bacterium]|nr:HAMP domain-containing histidine kinase [Candidatus Eisenbacteria bacterium]